MEDYEELYKTICRLCLCQGNHKNMFSLIDKSSNDGLSCYGKSVITFANISIKNDGSPQKMCQRCLFSLKQAIFFKKRCESSQQKLEEIVRKFGSSKSDLREKLCQFVMFTQSLPEVNIIKVPQKSISLKSLKEVGQVKKEKKVPKTEFTTELDYENLEFSDFFQADFHDESSDEAQNDFMDPEDLLKRMEEIVDIKPEIHNEYKTETKKKYKICNFVEQCRPKKREKRIKRVPRKIMKEVECKVCNKIFANRSSLKAHMQRHTDGKYICEHCAKAFATYAELQYHLSSSHDVGLQYTCKECGYKAHRKFELIEHERLHTGERPFACDKCGMTFRRQYIWKKHALYHMDKTVQCPQCPKKFHQRSEMKSHYNSVHERNRLYACSECDATYAKPVTVRKHLVDKHGIAREMQGKITRIKIGKALIN